MVRLYHLSLLLIAGLTAAAAVAADLPGGKKVTITMRYAAADSPGKKIRISVHYTDEDRGSDDQFQLDSDDDELYVSPLPSPPHKTHRRIRARASELVATTRRASEPEPPFLPHLSFF
jgi:hypothetical protein